MQSENCNNTRAANNGLREVFAKSRSHLKLLNLYTKNGIYIGKVRLPNLVLFALIAAPLTLELILLVWHCVDNKCDLKTGTTTISYIIIALQMLLVYLSLSVQHEIITEAIDDTEKFVMESKCWMKVFTRKKQKKSSTKNKVSNSHVDHETLTVAPSKFEFFIRHILCKSS